jgi:hypothetical protein
LNILRESSSKNLLFACVFVKTSPVSWQAGLFK